VNGRPCQRRVGKLYLPPGGRYYGCRHCHALTYTSCQEHDKGVDFLLRNPEALRLLAENVEGDSVAHLCLILKVLHKALAAYDYFGVAPFFLKKSPAVAQGAAPSRPRRGEG
jgi:hypothetical protein